MENDNLIAWKDVPLELDREWQKVFQATQEMLDLAAPCPVCGASSLHRWYDLHRKREREFEGKKFVGDGGLWEWCSACHCYMHYSAAVPDWWACDLKVNMFKLTHTPSAIEEARLERWSLIYDALMGGRVEAVSVSPTHSFAKQGRDHIRLLAGLGVEGDAHLGVTAQHRSRVAADPSQPNLRQVHLIHAELHDELRAAGFEIKAGQMGENITTRGLDLLGLPTGTRLILGADAVVEVTGLRNPCAQLDHFRTGLLAAVLGRDEAGNLVRKAGIMGVVLTSGDVRPGDLIRIGLPPEPHKALERV